MTNQKPAFAWTSCAATDKGKVRQINEDSYLDRPEIGLWAVADGMGGHDAGEVASRSVVHYLASISPARFLGQTVRQITQVLAAANQELLARAAEHGGRIIGTTVVVLYASEQHCAMLWVGDSRIYRLRQRSLSQLTRDHSYVEALIAEGLIDRSDAESHPDGSIITRAIGGGPELDVDSRVDQIYDQDVYLLCSDGVTKELGSDDISRVLRESDNPAENLVELALDRGARDNVTAVVAKFMASREGS
jgi:protein phosphatase